MADVDECVAIINFRFKEEGQMTKAELVVKIAEKAGMTKADAERCLNYFLDTVEETLVSEGKLTLTGFGTFQVDERKERVGRNPRTGDEIKIPACKVVKFRPGKLLKDAVK
ncbi:HU family DNA-binding protein [Desulfovibrio gilichinskyi]